jgi:hypothetical protein
MKYSTPFTILEPYILPKLKTAANGCYIECDGKLYFRSGREVICIREHFAETAATPEMLVENTIRYENESVPQNNLQNDMESESNPCYNTGANDVL